MSEYLERARACIQSAAQAPQLGIEISWLTLVCKEILNHLESRKDDDTLPQGEMDERPEPETDPRLQKLLDQTQFGDLLTITHRRGKHLANISGPVLSDQTHYPGVGIDLLDGEPYIVRSKAGIVWAPIAYATLCRDGELVAMWVEDAHH